MLLDVNRPCSWYTSNIYGYFIDTEDMWYLAETITTKLITSVFLLTGINFNRNMYK